MPNFMNAETALLLLEVDGSLHSVEDRKGRTALQYLADMPSAFKSGYSMGIFETLLYCCMPTSTTLIIRPCNTSYIFLV